MTTQTLTLTDFLLARIAEDEETAKRAFSLVPWVHIANAAAAHDQREAGLMVLDWRPSRVLTECEAKRRIVGRHTSCDETSFGEPCDDLRDLASVYADHPDYEESWRP